MKDKRVYLKSIDRLFDNVNYDTLRYSIFINFLYPLALAGLIKHYLIRLFQQPSYLALPITLITYYPACRSTCRSQQLLLLAHNDLNLAESAFLFPACAVVIKEIERWRFDLMILRGACTVAGRYHYLSFV